MLHSECIFQKKNKEGRNMFEALSNRQVTLSLSHFFFGMSQQKNKEEIKLESTTFSQARK